MKAGVFEVDVTPEIGSDTMSRNNTETIVKIFISKKKGKTNTKALHTH